MTWVPEKKKSAYLYAITTYDNKQRAYRAPRYSVPPLLTDQTGWPSNIFKYPIDNTENIFKYPIDNAEKNFKYPIEKTTLRKILNIQLKKQH